MDIRLVINNIRHHPWLTPVLVSLIIGSNAWTLVGYVDQHDPYGDYEIVLIHSTVGCNPMELPHTDSYAMKRSPLYWWLHCVSGHYTGSVKTISIIFNIGVMPLAYLIGSRLSKDRLIGLITLVAFINNPLYRDWWTSGTYDQMWSFFLFLSILLVHKSIAFWGGSFVASLASKSLGLLYLPALVYTSWQQKKSVNEIVIILLLVITFIGIASQLTNIVGNDVGFFPHRWEDAVYRNISVLWQVIPFLALVIVLNRNFIPKTKFSNEKVVWVWISCALLQNPIISFFTMQDTYSYRYSPLALFMSILIGMTIVNMGNWYVERKLTHL